MLVRVALITTILSTLTPLLGAAELDLLRLRLLQHYDPPLRWKNGALPPYWFDGIGVKKYSSNRNPSLVLPPGRSSRIVLPPLEILRVTSRGRRLSVSDLAFRIDNGSGLELEYRPQTSDDGRSLVIAPDASQPMLVRVIRADSGSSPLDVTLYVSRRDPIADTVTHRRTVGLNAPAVTLRRDDQPRDEMYHRIEAGAVCQAVVVGPTRLTLDSLLRYAPSEQQIEQSYEIRVQSGGLPWRNLRCQTTADMHHHWFVDGQQEVVGLVERSFIEVPKGEHRVEFESTAGLYLRLLAPRQPEFALPQLNSPPQFIPNDITRSIETICPWAFTGSDFSDLPWQFELFPAIAERLAYRSARDNQFSDGGLQASLLLRETALTHPALPEIRRLANRYRGWRTYYRDLSLSHAAGYRQSRFNWFRVTSIDERDDPRNQPVDVDLVLSENHLDDALDRLALGRFVQVHNSYRQANIYRRPVDRSTTWLRVAVERSSNTVDASLYLQFDERPPMLLILQPDQINTKIRKTMSVPEAALAALRHRHEPADASTLGGPFARFRRAAPLIKVAYAELLLPNEVSELRLWSRNADESPIHVAVQERVSRPYRLSEMEMLQKCQEMGCDLSVSGLARYVGVTAPAVSPPSSAHRDVINHLATWYRRQDASRRWYAGAVIPPQKISTRMNDPNNIPLHLVESDRLLPALEWTNRALWQSNNAETRREYLLKRATLLSSLNETYLYERQLRGLFLFDQDPRVRQAAREMLREFYTLRDDQRSLRAMTRVAVSQDAQNEEAPDALVELAQIQLHEGDAEGALLTSWMLPPNRRPVELVLRAAYQLRWWQTFRTHLAALPSDRLRAFWEAQYALSQGEYSLAEKAFHQAGTHGAKHLTQLREGLALARRLRSEKLVDRATAIIDWETWQANHPGPYVWRNEPSLIDEYTTTSRVKAVELGLDTEYAIAKPEMPIRLAVLGPVRMQLEMRPIHPILDGTTSDETTLDDWIEIRSAGRLWPVAVLDNRPSEGLIRVETPDRIVGTRVPFELRLGPGRHELTVTPKTHELLVRTLVERPEIPLPLLPWICEDVLDAVLAGKWGKRFRRDLHDTPSIQVLRSVQFDGSQIDVPWTDFQQMRPLLQNVNHADVPQWLAARMMLRSKRFLSSSRCKSTEALTMIASCSNVPIGERILAAERVGTLARMALSESSGHSQLESDQSIAILLARQETLRAAIWPIGDMPNAARRRMTVWLFLVERYPDLAPLCRVLGESMMKEKPECEGIRSLYRRLTSGSKWQQVSNVIQSAGLHRIKVTGLMPESPSQRVRHALLRPLEPGDYRLTGDQSLVLSLHNLQPSNIRISFRFEHLEYLPSRPVDIEWQFDNQVPQRKRIDLHALEEEIILAERGDHVLRVRLIEPYTNQFIHIRLEELIANKANTPSAYQPIIRDLNRVYMVATREEPIRIAVAGPAWIRIDQRQGETTFSRYQSVLHGQQTLTFTAPEGQDHALYRIFVRQYDRGLLPDAFPRKILPMPRAIVPIPKPLLARYRHVEPKTHLTRLDRSTEQLSTLFEDAFTLGRQHRGTWSIEFGTTERRPMEETFGESEPDKFMQFGVTHRYFDSMHDVYSTTALFYRDRTAGGSAGVSNTLWHDSKQWPVTWRMNTRACAQFPGGAFVPEENDTEWSLSWRGSVLTRREIAPELHHTPTFTLFARALSLHDNPYPAGRVDQDVYTPYKADHLFGAQWSDTLTWEPLADTQFRLRGSLGTNEDFNPVCPDFLSGKLSWRQLVGAIDLEAGYRITQYFDDHDRAESTTKHVLGIDLTWDLWTRKRHLGQIDFFFHHDLSREASSLGASLCLYFDAGRGYRDFAPDQLRFKSLKRRREAISVNNRIHFPSR